jgi:class 3 adenylate cyclase
VSVNAGVLFFDVKGYSELEHHELQRFHTDVCQKLSQIIFTDVSKYGPYLYKKTWGDGVVLVHTDMYHLAKVALGLRDYFNKAEYRTDAGGILNKYRLQCRTALHFGQFETVNDPIDETTNCFGKGIMLPARLEPVTQAGRVWATQGAIQHLYDAHKAFKFDQLCWSYMGHVSLAKHFDDIDVWEILSVDAFDIHGKRGNQDPPTPPPLSAPDLRPPASPEPEPYHPIDADEARRIHALTGRDPVSENISVCSRNRDVEDCPGKARSVLAISELERNTQSATEEAQVARWIHEIHAAARLIVDHLNSRADTLQYTDLWVLNRNIDDLLSFFSKHRHDSTWPDAQDWPAGFLIWRLKTADPDNAEKICESFLTTAKVFSQYFNASYVEGEGPAAPGSIQLPRQIVDSVHLMREYGALIDVWFNKVGERRLHAIKSIVESAFVGFDRFLLATKHVKHLTDRLRSDSDLSGVGGVWT